MFLLGGASVRRIAEFHRKDLPAQGREAVVERELREDMIIGGALERYRKPASIAQEKA